VGALGGDIVDPIGIKLWRGSSLSDGAWTLFRIPNLEVAVFVLAVTRVQSVPYGE